MAKTSESAKAQKLAMQVPVEEVAAALGVSRTIAYARFKDPAFTFPRERVGHSWIVWRGPFEDWKDSRGKAVALTTPTPIVEQPPDFSKPYDPVTPGDLLTFLRHLANGREIELSMRVRLVEPETKAPGALAFRSSR